MNKTRQSIVETFIRGLKEAWRDSKGKGFVSYSSVPSTFVHGVRALQEAEKMVEEGLALWLDEEKRTLGISGKGRKEFFTREVLDTLHNE
jgi:hypothetical protein